MSSSQPGAALPFIEGIDHIDLAVEDIESACAWYEQLGFSVVRRTTHVGGAVELRFPGQGAQPLLELVPCTAPDGRRLAEPGIRHIGLKCSDIHGVRAQLIDRGVPFARPPGYYAPTQRWLCNTEDPSGNVMQLVGATS